MLNHKELCIKLAHQISKNLPKLLIKRLSHGVSSCKRLLIPAFLTFLELGVLTLDVFLAEQPLEVDVRAFVFSMLKHHISLNKELMMVLINLQVNPSIKFNGRWEISQISLELTNTTI